MRKPSATIVTAYMASFSRLSRWPCYLSKYACSAEVSRLRVIASMSKMRAFWGFRLWASTHHRRCIMTTDPGRWLSCSGRLLSGGNSILSNFLPTVNGFLVFAIENSFERPHILVTHDTAEILLGRQHGGGRPTLRHRLVPPSAYSPGPPANPRMRILNQVRAGQAAM